MSLRTIMTRTSAVLLMIVFAATACDTPTVPPLPAGDVYEFRLATSPPLTLRWPLGSEVRVFVVDGGAADTGLLADALREGAAAWDEHALLDEYRLVLAGSAAQADVLLAWSDAALPVDESACPRTPGRGVTTFCLDGDALYRYPLSGSASSDVRMLVTIAAQLAQSTEVVRASVAHELGHVLGIARHSPDPADLLWAGELTRTTPSMRDIATVRALYRSDADVQP